MTLPSLPGITAKHQIPAPQPNIQPAEWYSGWSSEEAATDLTLTLSLMLVLEGKVSQLLLCRATRFPGLNHAPQRWFWEWLWPKKEHGEVGQPPSTGGKEPSHLAADRQLFVQHDYVLFDRCSWRETPFFPVGTHTKEMSTVHSVREVFSETKWVEPVLSTAPTL